MWWIVAWAVIGRIGLGFVLPSLNVGVSTINFMRQLGGAVGISLVGISLVGILLGWRLQVHAGDAVRAFHETFVLIGLITACAVIAALRMGPPMQPLPLPA